MLMMTNMLWMVMLTLMLASMENPQKQMRANPSVTWDKELDYGDEDYDDQHMMMRIMTTMVMPVLTMMLMMITMMPVMRPMERSSPHSHSGPNWPRTT